jgi:D-alanyl-lipoteichoic acid acyltransferase DltB (MBOAT superfamily)
VNFVTLSYGIFLAVVVLLYWLLPRRAGRWFLIIASLIFYGSWNALYVPGFAALLAVNWGFGLLAVSRPRLAVAATVAVDLGLLAVFKYLDWLIGSSAGFLELVTGDRPTWGLLGLVLPLAISFVTFTMLAYVIDVARGARPERRVERFALFVTFFPHLIAGPIMRGHEFLPQVRHPRPLALVHFRLALPLLVGGFVKKVLGDNLAPSVNAVFADPGSFATPYVWVGIVAFAFQIYLDFSGYTDIALGSAHLLGFRLPRNFDWPYRSTSIQEFWRRWHMTLSRWLRDYLYIPLGGSRHGQARTYLALLITMVLGGLWHGAGFTFLVWGLWHGAGLAANRWWQRDRPTPIRIPSTLAWPLTFGFVLVGWVFFRAESIPEAFRVLFRSVTFRPDGETLPLAVVLLCCALLIGQSPGWARLFGRLAPTGSARRSLAYGAAVAIAVLLMPVETVSFIYFQF